MPINISVICHYQFIDMVVCVNYALLCNQEATHFDDSCKGFFQVKGMIRIKRAKLSYFALFFRLIIICRYDIINGSNVR